MIQRGGLPWTTTVELGLHQENRQSAAVDSNQSTGCATTQVKSLKFRTPTADFVEKSAHLWVLRQASERRENRVEQGRV